MRRTWTWWLLAAGCGAARPAAPPPPSNTGGVPEVRVYAWSGAGLDGLYCARGGVLDADGCTWPDALVLPDTTLPGRTERREMLDGSVERVRTYGARRSGPREVALVVERDGAVAVWAASFPDDAGLEQALPVAPPDLVADAVGVTTFPLLVPGAAGPRAISTAISVDTPAGPRTADLVGYGAPVPYAALDLDGDGFPELVYLYVDDGGAYAAARELSDDVEPFTARRQ